MKKAFLLLALLSAGFLGTFAAPDYSGSWTGYITQHSPSALATNYYFNLVLEVNGDEISGHSEIRMWDEHEVYGIMDVEGTFDDYTLELNETEITRQQIYNYAVWCLKNMKLQYVLENGVESLRGRWFGAECSGPGDVYLERTPAG